jgi:hypothetical protein
MHFDKTWYLRFLRKSVKKVLVLLTSNMFRHFWRYLVKFFLKWEGVEKIKTHFTFYNFFSENRNIYEIMSKTVAENKGPQMTSEYGAYALHAGLARLHARMRMYTPGYPHAHTHAHACTHRPVSNTSCFSAATMIRERASILRYKVRCLSRFLLRRVKTDCGNHCLISKVNQGTFLPGD